MAEQIGLCNGSTCCRMLLYEVQSRKVPYVWWTKFHAFNIGFRSRYSSGGISACRAGGEEIYVGLVAYSVHPELVFNSDL